MSPKHVPEGVYQHSTNGAFSPIVFAGGNTLFAMSGQGAMSEQGEVIGETIEEQTRVVFDTIQRKLSAIGATLDDVFKVTVYLENLDDWAAFNRVYAEIMPKPFPARTAVGSQLLKEMLVEIDIWGSIDRPENK